MWSQSFFARQINELFRLTFSETRKRLISNSSIKSSAHRIYFYLNYMNIARQNKLLKHKKQIN